MKKHLQLILICFCVASSVHAQKNDPVNLKVQEDMNRVEVYVGGKLFTAYRFEPSLEKPVLYPIHAPSGIVVTRGFPISPREKERVDHPHHVGLWFNFGDVNGFDFWNNSYAVPEESKGNYGRIIHKEIEKAETEEGKGILKVKMDWLAPDNTNSERLLEEKSTYIFSGNEGSRIVDRITSLTAVADRVVFTDNKEGMLAIRVDRAFEHPEELDNEGVTGWYLNSEGDEGPEAWGKNARWVQLTGTKEGSTCSLILMDHPQNINSPACWHARGYGLFSVNNLGRQVYNRELEKFQLILLKGETLTFRHRFVVASGKLPTREIESLYKDFISE
jgi:hypothetical protein